MVHRVSDHIPLTVIFGFILYCSLVNYHENKDLNILPTLIIWKHFITLDEKKTSLDKHIRGSLNKFPDFFRMGTFIDSTQKKLLDQLFP